MLPSKGLSGLFESGYRAKAFDTRIALVSSGLSHVQRGFETFIYDLYEALQDQGNVTLFKGSGTTAPGVIPVPTLRRNHPLLKALIPANEHQRYRAEQISMALSGWMHGHWQQASIIHFCDPAFGNLLVRLRRQFNYSYQLLFANCGPALPEDYKQFDHIQEFTPQYLNDAKKVIRKTRLHLNPMGIWTERFRLDESRARLREAWNIPPDKFVILCTASLDEPYKRLPFLIDTVAGLDDPNIHLLLVGQNNGTAHARSVLEQVKAQLPGRHQHLTVPYMRVPELYNAADMFILPSLQEGFGKVYLEAMASNLPLLCHTCPNTLWIMREPDSLVNMENAADVQNAIRRMRHESGSGISEFGRNMAETNRRWVRDRFHWTSLRSEYIDMYDRIISLPA